MEQNIQSALVLEADADWDIRIKQQMRQFAQASRLLLQPLAGTDDAFLDPTNPQPNPSDQPSSYDILEYELENPTTQPVTSPYGDLHRWDLLWLGHCGSRFPWASDGNAPLGRAVISNDDTVPEKHYIDIEMGDHQLSTSYPDHTRVVSRARVNTCTLAHAYSQQGARKFLYELGINRISDPTDMMFRAMCDGSGGRPLATCLTVQPQLFQHHRPRGPKAKESEISSHGDGFNEHSFTANVRWSTRINLPKLVLGETDYFDLYPDGGTGPAWAD